MALTPEFVYQDLLCYIISSDDLKSKSQSIQGLLKYAISQRKWDTLKNIPNVYKLNMTENNKELWNKRVCILSGGDE